MKCMLCGTENRQEALRCKGCGASLTGTPAQPIGRTPSPTILEPGAAPRAASPRKTRLASPDEVARAAAIASPGASAPAPSGGASSNRRRTVYQAPAQAGGAPGDAKAGDEPRIFGFLISYTWKAGGQFYVLREGKNIFGSQAGLDGTVAEDKAMSGKHFTVMYRKGKVRVRDLDSTNATQVDGEEIWGDSVEAGHGSAIEAGDTAFTLVLIPGVAGDATPEDD